MRILAASLLDSVDQFLHAGYISAYPRTLYPDMLLEGAEPTLQLDMVQALALQGDTAAAALGSGSSSLAAASAVASPELWAVAAAAAVGAAGLTLLQRRLGLKPRAALAAGALAGLMVVGQVSCGDPGADEKALAAPWEGVELQAFADPEAATQAILYGIVADGLANVDFDVDELKHIQLEVGLPTTTPSEGMAHALLTYGYDGWRNALKLERRGGADEDENYLPVYTVTSAGADGSFGTDDDLSIEIEGSTDGSWDVNRWASFLRQDDQGELTMLFHRWRGEHFEYLHQAEAKAMTGGELFDLFQAGDLEYWLGDLQAAYDTAAAETEQAPILLQVFRSI
jgi:hypothetical protein